MSKKVTFGELIESIAEETDNSKEFTHDFLKDFVDVINGGLKEDGKVNIAGFGKFELQRVDEREGYNPQTQEKMTIPAHNKVVFKPYKDLRELVNAPYAHMEPQLIEEEPESSEKDFSPSDQQTIESQTEESGVENDRSTDEETEQLEQEQKSGPDITESSEEQELIEDDFIPTAPPTLHEQKSNEDEAQGEDQEETDQESPFDFGVEQDFAENTAQTSTPESSEGIKDDDDNGDIVEFGATQSEEEDDLLEEFIGSQEKEQEDESSEDLAAEEELEPEKNEIHESGDEPAETVSSDKDDKEKEPTKSEEEVLAEEVEKLEETAEDLKQDQPDQSDQQDVKETYRTATTSHRSDRGSSFSYVAAAVIILLLIAGGAWYYSTIPTNDTTLFSSSEETTTSADVTDQQDNNTQPQSSEQQEAEDAQQTTQSQAQSGSQTPATAQSTNNKTPNNQAVEIEEGQTLWSLAKDRYGNPRLWPWIYGNNGSLDDPDLIYAGSSLSVPLPSGPQNTLTSTDSVGVAKGFIATYKWYKSNEQSKAKNHLWAAKLYHDNLQQLADVPIDKTDLSYANRAR
ncbi:HU family DNA-binding protein [Fodinibius sp. AD559]|uniref:HU family DNA-binding protein n=1 Tax=Fodinibius sp. AD559 TaxID=3424179 RepID=UPI004046AACC